MRIRLSTNQPNVILGSKNTGKEKELPVSSKVVGNSALSAEKNAKAKRSKLARAITMASLASVGIVFTMSKGLQSGRDANLNKIKNFLDDKLVYSSLKESVKWHNFYEFSLRKINASIKRTESVNNITSLKDVLFMRMMFKTRFTRNIHEQITKYFEKISRNKIFSSYKKPENSLIECTKFLMNSTSIF